MAKVLVTEDYLKNIGDAIRSKNETEDKFTPSQMADAIANIKAEEPFWTTDGRLYYKKLEIPDGITSIGTEQYRGSFRSCMQLETVIIPNSVETIWHYSFSNCTNLTEVSFGSGITTIAAYAFDNCKSLKKIDLINSAITSVSSASFVNCTSVETLTLPATLTVTTTSNNTQGSFNKCSSLKYVTLEDGFLCNLNLSASTQFSANAIIVMLNALGEVPKQETRTLTLGATNLAKLTDTQKQIATDKGWTLA